MILGIADYTPYGQYISDGRLILNFMVTTINLDTLDQISFPVQNIYVPMGTSTEDLQTILRDALRAEAENQGMPIDEDKLTMPYFVQA